MATAAVDKPTDLFKKSWDAYKIIVDDDYLSHKSLYAALESHLEATAKAKGRPLSLLELGCGDSTHMSRLLQHAQGREIQLLSSYTGVDLAEGALELARARMTQAWGGTCQLNFHVSDLLAYVKGTQKGGEFDAILVSFSLHHLQTEQKADFLRSAHTLLEARQGAVLLVDVVSRPGETQQEYHERMKAVVLATWNRLGDDGKALLLDHMRNHDYPESVQTYQQMGKETGFKSVNCQFAAEGDLYKFLTFQA